MLAQAMIENSTAKPLRRQQCVDAEARAGARAIDVDLREHGEGDVVVERAEGLDLLRIPRFLLAELVAGKAENRKAARRELLVKLLQPRILGGEAAFAGGVDDEQNLAAKIGEGHILAGQGLG